jgi:hypothetical protein
MIIYKESDDISTDYVYLVTSPTVLILNFGIIFDYNFVRICIYCMLFSTCQKKMSNFLMVGCHVIPLK